MKLGPARARAHTHTHYRKLNIGSAFALELNSLRPKRESIKSCRAAARALTD
ncbi:uncharacterized protein EI90DRAFT_3082995 [Cantharellus anzutake]|uniref:uncharacterized protein n=1 Tax=Cantharellus anzutake TaxID=1750568 RepID=UPI001905F3C8|nr:uncharacterized protein EI90DRAFT_3082995 [Cantharellus anzutake]KAF8318580.1 hypothetical protein EI90DRAFT_3082995 [Cantharellus anzutake]